MTSAALTDGPARRGPHDERQLLFDEGVVHLAAGDDAAFGDEPVVVEEAVVGFGGADERAHRFGGEADLVAFDGAAVGQFEVADLEADAVGIFDVGMVEPVGDRFGPFAGLFGFVDRLGRLAVFVGAQVHGAALSR